MNYNFDEPIDRRGSGSVRWDNAEKKFGAADVIPLTTADMDFRCDPSIIDAVKKAADFGVLGYTQAVPSYYEAVIARFASVWHWDIRREWIMMTPGVVGAVAYLIQGLTNPGDGIVLPVPMYHPFAHLIEDNGRTILRAPLLNRSNVFTLDFDCLERQLARPEAKMLIFCNPHNPIGRAWTYEEIRRLCELCLKYDVTLVSDEIHCDFVFSGHQFVSAASGMLALGGLDHLVVCSAASKSFNIAGMQTSNIIIPDEKRRAAFGRILGNQHLMELNALGPVAAEAAYRHAQPWLDACLEYLEGTRDFMADYIRRNIPEITPVVPEATYMMWLDCRRLGLSDKALNELFVQKAKVGLNIGSSFGLEGAGYVRINFASPRKLIAQVLENIEKAVHGKI